MGWCGGCKAAAATAAAVAALAGERRGSRSSGTHAAARAMSPSSTAARSDAWCRIALQFLLLAGRGLCGLLPPGSQVPVAPPDIVLCVHRLDIKALAQHWHKRELADRAPAAIAHCAIAMAQTAMQRQMPTSQGSFPPFHQ